MNRYACHSCRTEHSEDNMAAYCASCYRERANMKYSYICYECKNEQSIDGYSIVAYCAGCYNDRKIEDDLIAQLAKERAESERLGKELHKANNELQSARYLLDKANEQILQDKELNNCLRPPTSQEK